MLQAAPRQSPLAVVAVGGYGRGVLSPHSDVDLWLVAWSGVEREVVRALLYPLWDLGLQVGHAVGTPEELIERATSDVHAATALVNARFIAGEIDLFEELAHRRARWLRRNAKQFVRGIRRVTAERHRNVERAGWSLAPNLKDDIGGLRDLDTVGWLAAAAGEEPSFPELVNAGEMMLAAREALHGEVKRKVDRLRMDLQPKIAQRLGLDGDADRLMIELHSAARVIEHRGARASDALAEAVLGGPRRSGVIRILDRGVGIEDGVLVHRPDGDGDRLSAGMRLLAAKAKTGGPIAGGALEWLASCFRGAPPERWPDATRTAFMSLLRAPDAAATLELLDHVGGWHTLLPEWQRVRGLAQHDPYHRYTVDGHSFLTVGELAHVLAEQGFGVITSRENRSLDALYLAALLHDVGKGSGTDHTVEGERVARAACRRMGASADELEDVAMLVRHHLVLADVATRRDLDDAAVISEVAAAVGSTRRLWLLYILSVADGLATGPAAWSDWKAALVLELYGKVLNALETGQATFPTGVGARASDIEAYEPALQGRAEELLTELPPSYSDSAAVEQLAGELTLMLSPPQLGEVTHRIDEHPDCARASLAVCTRDRPGTLARTSGVLTLNRISILRAQAYATSSGLALQRFVVATRPETRWESVLSDLRAAYSGRIALDARLVRKARDYLTKPPPEVDVRVLQEASSHSTIVEIRAQDALGLLYAVVAGLSDLDLDIHVAKIDTRQGRVVDVFYVRTVQGTKLSDDQIAALRQCVSHRLERMFGSG